MAVMCIIVTSEPRLYRDVLATMLQTLRPDIDVLNIAPDSVDGHVVRLNPHLVVCSELTHAMANHAFAWIILYPDGKSLAVIHIGGHRTVVANLDVPGLLAAVDRTQDLAQMW